jgi:hypothetical protein
MAITCEDRAAITEVIAKHGHLCDSGELDRLDEIFTADVIYDLTDFGQQVPRGRQACAAAARVLGELNPRHQRRPHPDRRWQRPRPVQGNRYQSRRHLRQRDLRRHHRRARRSRMADQPAQIQARRAPSAETELMTATRLRLPVHRVRAMPDPARPAP